MTFYEAQHGYGGHYGVHTFLVTDDVLYAREQILKEMHHQMGAKNFKESFRAFDDKFQEFLKDEERGLYFRVRDCDYHYALRIAQLRVAVTPLSTIQRST